MKVVKYSLTLDKGVVIADAYVPGAEVHYDSKTYENVYGIIVAVDETHFTVLWSNWPELDFSKFAFPTIRKVTPQLIANDLVKIQPMTAPVGNIFYLDYMSGSKNIP